MLGSSRPSASQLSPGQSIVARPSASSQPIESWATTEHLFGPSACTVALSSVISLYLFSSRRSYPIASASLGPAIAFPARSSAVVGGEVLAHQSRTSGKAAACSVAAQQPAGSAQASGNAQSIALNPIAPGGGGPPTHADSVSAVVRAGASQVIHKTHMSGSASVTTQVRRHRFARIAAGPASAIPGVAHVASVVNPIEPAAGRRSASVGEDSSAGPWR